MAWEKELTIDSFVKEVQQSWNVISLIISIDLGSTTGFFSSSPKGMLQAEVKWIRGMAQKPPKKDKKIT
jgi:hypothetical protein